MATANLFHREIKANKSPRNAFDVSYSSLFSSPVGLILPTYVQEVKIGDKLKLEVSSLTRTSPLETPAFMSFDEKTDFWFVPYKLIWSDYDNWRLGQTFRNKTTDLTGAGKQNYLPFCSYRDVRFFFMGVTANTDVYDISHPNYATAFRYLDLLMYSVPNIESMYDQITNNLVFDQQNQVAELTDKYYDALGLITPMNYFRLAAFQCIYQHGYRFEEYEPLDPSYYNVDNLFANLNYQNDVIDADAPQEISSPSRLAPFPITGSDYSSISNKLTMSKLFTPRYKNWRKDIFTTAKPDSGFALGTTGLEFDTSIQPSATSLYGSGFYYPTQDVDRKFPLGGAKTDNEDARYNPLNNLDANSYNDTRIDWTYQATNSNPANVVQRLFTEFNGDKSFGLTFLYPQNIRNLMAQDKFSRSAIYADKDYSAQMKAIFGEDKTEYNKPLYLGSYSSNISIDDVTATGAGTANENGNPSTVLGQLGGKVKQAGNDNNVFSRTFNDDGVVIGVHYVMPRNNYDSYRINKFNTKISRFDYFYPQFDGLGLQPILSYERNLPVVYDPNIIYSRIAKASSLFGFVPRYYEYKQRTNEVHGAFQSNQADRDWTLTNNGSYANADGAILDSSHPSNYKIYPNITDRIFGVNYNGSVLTDPFQHYYYYKATLVSDMEIYGTPSL